MDDQTTRGMRAPRGPRAEDATDERDVQEPAGSGNPVSDDPLPQDATQVEDTIPPADDIPARGSPLGSVGDTDVPGGPG